MNCRIRTSFRLLGTPHRKNNAVTRTNGARCSREKILVLACGTYPGTVPAALFMLASIMYDHLRGYILAIRTFARDHMNTQNRGKQIILQTLIFSGPFLLLPHLAQAQGYER